MKVLQQLADAIRAAFALESKLDCTIAINITPEGFLFMISKESRSLQRSIPYETADSRYELGTLGALFDETIHSVVQILERPRNV